MRYSLGVSDATVYAPEKNIVRFSAFKISTNYELPNDESLTEELFAPCTCDASCSNSNKRMGGY